MSNDTDKYLDNDHFDKDGDGIADKTEKKIETTMSTDYKMPELPDVPKKKFWDTAFGRTIRLKNKTGKIGVTVLGGIGSSFIPGPVGNWINKGFNALITTQTGIGMEALLDFNITQLIIMAVALIITWALPSLFPSIKEKHAWNLVEGRLDQVTDEVVKAIDEDSEKGKKVSRNELKAIIESAIKKDDSP